MDYSLKINLDLRGVESTPCLDCPLTKEPVVPIWEKAEKCFQRCPYEILVWILNKEQLEKYEKLRPPERREVEIKRAINERKIVQIEETLRRV